MMDRIRVLQEIRMQRFEEIHARFMKRRNGLGFRSERSGASADAMRMRVWLDFWIGGWARSARIGCRRTRWMRF